MYELTMNYGAMVLGTILAVLGLGLTRYVFVLIDNNIIRESLVRLWDETKAAVLEVGQTYVDALKEASLDGKLTDEEKAEAKSKAIAIAKSNLGKKGLLRLSRILDIDKWIGGKVEAFVRESKMPKAIANPPEA